MSILEIDKETLPQICEICLGSKLNQRLVKDSAGSPCRQCNKSFISYRWKLGKSRSKHTIVCTECAEINKCCQSCVLDIEFHISLALREASLRIMFEEGGSWEDRVAVLAAVAREYGEISDRTEHTPRVLTMEEIIEMLPEMPRSSQEFVRPDGCTTLCIYGIETDLNRQLVRAYLKSPIANIVWMEAANMAFFRFINLQSVPQLSDHLALIDGRLLHLAWGGPVNIPEEMQPDIGGFVRAQLRQIRSET